MGTVRSCPRLVPRRDAARSPTGGTRSSATGGAFARLGRLAGPSPRSRPSAAVELAIDLRLVRLALDPQLCRLGRHLDALIERRVPTRCEQTAVPLHLVAAFAQSARLLA